MIPEDVLIQILVWLPVISLLRCKAVCKSWYALIQSPNFITQHIQKKGSSRLIVKGLYETEGFHLCSGPNFEACIFNLDFPQCFFNRGDNRLHVASSVNGIVCIYKAEAPCDIFLWNPATKQCTLLPDPILYLDQSYIGVGFGFDARTNDYKVVRIISTLDYVGICVNNRVDVYSSSTNSWRILETVLPVDYIVEQINPSDGGSCHNGVYIWLGASEFVSNRFGGWSVLSFDFSDEVFQNIALPDGITEPRLGFVGESIGFINHRDLRDYVLSDRDALHPIEIWVFNEKGVKECSWSRLYSIGSFASHESPSWFFSNGEVVLFRTVDYLNKFKDRLFLFNPNTQQMKELLPDRQYPKWDNIDIVPYKESLVSIKGS